MWNTIGIFAENMWNRQAISNYLIDLINLLPKKIFPNNNSRIFSNKRNKRQIIKLRLIYVLKMRDP